MSGALPRRAALSAVLFLFAAALCPPDITAQANPFFTPSERGTSGSEQPDDRTDPPGSTGAVGRRFGAWLTQTDVYRALVRMQKQIQSILSQTISSQKASGGVRGVAVLIGISFAYGFLHALGPGHRKIVLSSYFLSESTGAVTRMATGVATAYGIGLVHAGSAMLLIFGLHALVTGPVMNRFTSISLDVERASYVLLIVLGLVLLVMAATPHRKTDGKNAVRTGSRLAFILASGAIPCPGAAAVLVFGIGTGAPGLGALAALSMSVGIGTLLAILVVLTITVKGLVGGDQAGQRLLGGRFGHVAERILEIVGALVIIGFGALMLLPS